MAAFRFTDYNDTHVWTINRQQMIPLGRWLTDTAGHIQKRICLRISIRYRPEPIEINRPRTLCHIGD
jgi:hypothetical protein